MDDLLLTYAHMQCPRCGVDAQVSLEKYDEGDHIDLAIYARCGCLLTDAEEDALMQRADTEDRWQVNYD